jgi:cytochrome c-type biogenesis protein CcmF
VGYFFLAFLTVAAILSFTLLYTRWGLLEADVRLESVVSREAAFLFNNLLLVGVAFSVLWGTLFPILSELVRGTKITVGAPFFNRVNIPLGLLLLGLTGIGPLIAWRKASTANLKRQFIAPVACGLITLLGVLALGVRDFYATVALSLAGFVAGTIVQEFYRGVRARKRMHAESVPLAFARLISRNRRRYGGYIVHVGVLIYFVAFTGMAFKRQYEALNRIVSAATVQVTKDGRSLGLITSEKRQHVDSFKRPTFEPSTEVGIRSNLQEDLYIVYAGSVGGTEEAVYRFNINPLVWWVWFGGFVLALGGILTMWPGGGAMTSAPRRAQAGYEVTLVGAGKD